MASWSQKQSIITRHSAKPKSRCRHCSLAMMHLALFLGQWRISQSEAEHFSLFFFCEEQTKVQRHAGVHVHLACRNTTKISVNMLTVMAIHWPQMSIKHCTCCQLTQSHSCLSHTASNVPTRSWQTALAQHGLKIANDSGWHLKTPSSSQILILLQLSVFVFISMPQLLSILHRWCKSGAS